VVASIEIVAASNGFEYDGSMEVQQFMYVFGPGERPELRADRSAWTEEDEAVLAAHFEYLTQATAAGQVILAGRPLGPDGPAMVIFEAESEAAAKDFMEDDPFISNGLFTADLYPFNAALVRGETSS
jgi:uncharacterized protein YciI